MSDRLEKFLEDNELAHYGVKGMKWGKRRNPDYTDQQVKRDVQVYGKRGASRINKSLNDGNSISVARGDEKTRRDRVMGKNKYVRQGGKAAAAVGGVAAANVAISGLRKATYTAAGQRFLNSTLGSGAGMAAMRVADIASSPAARVVVSAGAAKVGSMLAGDAAVGLNMRLHGYDPNRR